MKVSGEWRYLCRTVDQFGQVIDVMLSQRRDALAARRFLDGALVCAARPVEVNTDRVGHAFIQNLRRRHYELGMETAAKHRLAESFDEFALAI